MNYPGPQYPGFPQQPQQYAQPGYPQAPPQQYAPPQQQFTQPAYPAQQAPQQPPAPPLATGSIDDYYSQPSAGGGPSISWKDKPIGHHYIGIVARDVTNADIQQQTDPQTKQPKFYRDGRPQFVMKVPLIVQPSAQFPEGEATLFVRGQMRDELVRAMSEVGQTGAPTKGATIVVQLAGKRNTGAIPANQFAIQYQLPGGAGAAPAAPVQPAPVQQPAPQAPQLVQQPPAQQFTQQPVQQVAQPQQYAQPAQQAAPQQFAQGGAVQAPVQQQPQVQQSAPSGMSAEQQELLARLTGQQPAA